MARLVDESGTTVFEGVIEGGGGLPSGWTQDENDPANVSTNGGRLLGGPSTTLELRGGDLATPGNLDLLGGTSDGDASGGNIFIASGAGSATANAGNVDISAGASDAGGNAGGVAINGGTGAGATDNGGGVEISPGAALGSGEGGSLVLRDSGSSAVVRIDDGGLGFFNSSTVARPEAPASPDAQDVVNVLVALGLCTQAAP